MTPPDYETQPAPATPLPDDALIEALRKAIRDERDERPGFAYADTDAAIHAVATELAGLRRWKADALYLDGAVGRELDIPIGASIRASILHAVKRLKEDAARPSLGQVQDRLTLLKNVRQYENERYHAGLFDAWIAIAQIYPKTETAWLSAALGQT